MVDNKSDCLGLNDSREGDKPLGLGDLNDCYSHLCGRGQWVGQMAADQLQGGQNGWVGRPACTKD